MGALPRPPVSWPCPVHPAPARSTVLPGRVTHCSSAGVASSTARAWSGRHNAATPGPTSCSRHTLAAADGRTRAAHRLRLPWLPSFVCVDFPYTLLCSSVKNNGYKLDFLLDQGLIRADENWQSSCAEFFSAELHIGEQVMHRKPLTMPIALRRHQFDFYFAPERSRGAVQCCERD